ncbi:hypothetical protein AMS68_002766 [Peltaster fructicola]|uniref:Uncharacterized protein n=1 Tax=Peltaster fructicola TaxID=286661 RepID=A0A6H0XRJ5_9PEZI|nr:hypothetical protein AMS68_002766 [Peltaster fructicola]
MANPSAIALVAEHPILLLVVVLVGYLLHNRYRENLSRFEGPWYSSLSSIGTLYQTWADGDELPYIHLHHKYGKVVRIGPKKLSFAQPQAIRDIYGPQGIGEKSDFHIAHQQIANGVTIRTLFASTDKQWHDDVRRCVASAYSMSSMVQYEALVDESIGVLLAQLGDRFADKPGNAGVVDFPRWLHFFADDAITCVAYGKRIGHMEAGEDIEGMLAYGIMDSKRSMLIGQAIWLELFGRRNPAYLWLQRQGYFRESDVPLSVKFATTHQAERRRLRAQGKKDNDSGLATLTDKFLSSSAAHPEVVGDDEVLAMGLSIVAAGSDTTGISLSALFYHLMQNPDRQRKLIAEVDAALPTRQTTLTFAQAQKLPYLTACIKETFRLHPATRYAPERVTPPHGHTIAGQQIPGGTVVFVSAWVIHRDPEIYGDDVDTFRPERWLEGDAEHIKTMERSLFHFGIGNYSCLGKNVALLEMYKVVPALLRRFEISFADPKNTRWSYDFGTFVTVKDFNVRLSSRIPSFGV